MVSACLDISHELMETVRVMMIGQCLFIRGVMGGSWEMIELILRSSCSLRRVARNS